MLVLDINDTEITLTRDGEELYRQPGVADVAVTVDDATMTFARSWELTSGATWRLTVGFLVSAVPLSLLMLPVKVHGLATDADPTSGLDIALGIASGALSFIAIAIGASFLSFAYLRLVPEYEKAAIGAM